MQTCLARSKSGIREGKHGAFHHADHRFPHSVHEVDIVRGSRPSSLRDNFRDVRREIADPFHVRYHLQSGGDHTHIGSHGLLREEQLQTQIFDGAFRVVDDAVLVDDFLRHDKIVRAEGFHGVFDGVFDVGPHLQHIHFQFF